MINSMSSLAVGTACAVAVLLSLPNPASCQSFPCYAARTCTERVICATPQIARLDEEMAERYHTLRSLSSRSGAQALLSSQRQWLRDRDTCGCNANCLVSYYVSRIRLFDDILSR